MGLSQLEVVTMSERAIVFPGQGAQQPGMAAEILAACPAAAEVMETANEALGFDLASICREGPAERLEATDICQPAILATSAAVVRALETERGLDRATFGATAGLSLGEYTALWFAGSLSLEDALRLVRRRGEAMQAASEAAPSGMLSLLGADREKAEALAADASSAGVCVAANILGPGSVAISGASAAIDRAESIARDHGVRRAVRLKVAGAFHSPLMASATAVLTDALASVEIHPPTVPFFTNVTGDRVEDPERIRAHLAEQVTSPVLWLDTMRAFEALGMTSILEPAPGRVLTGLLRKSAPGISGSNVETMDELGAWA